MLILCVTNFLRFSSQWFRGARQDAGELQGVEQDLRRIEQIYSRLYKNEDTLGATKLNIKISLHAGGWMVEKNRNS